MMLRARNRGAHAAAHRAPRTGPLRTERDSGPVSGGSQPGSGDRQVGGLRSMGVRLRRARLRRDQLRGPRAKIAAMLAVAAVVIAVAVGGGRPSAEPTVQAFLLAWESGNYHAAAAMTTGRGAVVTAALQDVYQQLDASGLELAMGRISQHGDTAAARFSASVDLGSSGLRWSYQGDMNLRRAGSGWKVVWSPSVIVPGLQAGQRVAVVTTVPARASLTDSAGTPLIPASSVYVVGVRPGQLANAAKTASALAAATGLYEDQVYGQIIAAPDSSFLELLQLRPAAYQRYRAALSRVPGLIVMQRRERLFGSIAPLVTGSVGTEMASVLRAEGMPYRPGTTVGQSGLEQTFQRLLAGTPTTKVVIQDAAGRVVSVLRTWPGATGKPVQTTINARTQVAADDALASMPDSAAIVAIRAGTGQILAVASHQAGGEPPVSPLSGEYNPGQAFTIVSTAALLGTGFTVNSPIPCESANPVGGDNFSNDPRVPGLGPQPPFTADFADACTTAFAGLSMRLDAADLTDAASGFGIGLHWQLPVGGFVGTVGHPAGTGAVAQATVGEGSVMVSPLDMALAAGVVESGSWHPPVLVTSPPDPGLAPRTAFSAQVVSSLQTLMRQSVTDGAARSANVTGGAVYGQVGSAPVGPPAEGVRAFWFVGYQGNVAFAAIEFAKSGYASAAPLAGSFLTDLHG